MASGGKLKRRPRRPRLGQHFLRDARVLDRIVEALGVEPGRTVVEIGPGEGALTRRLIAAGARIVAIELDGELSERLREEFSAAPFELIEDDVLNVDLSAAAGNEPALLVGNLPYYITSPIVRRALTAGDRFERSVFLVQKETGERIAADKGSRNYGYLSVLTRLHAEPQLLFTVPPGAFQPPPRVHSAVIRLTPNGGGMPDPSLVRFLEAAFRQPRKNLVNNLGALYGKAIVSEQPEARLRAQQLDVQELQGLWRRLELLTRSEP